MLRLTWLLTPRGKVVCPGFIDTHVHSDLDLLARPEHIPALAQGITTEILGQDRAVYLHFPARIWLNTVSTWLDSMAILSWICRGPVWPNSGSCFITKWQ